MSEERKMILKMLSEGTINAEEAVKLLNAIGVPEAEKRPRHKVDRPKFRESHRKSPRRGKHYVDRDDIDSDNIKRSIRDARVASKEALQSVKESVHEAIEESRKALSETVRNRKLESNIDRVRGIDEGLAEEWQEAEIEFEMAKEMHSKVQAFSDEITELNDFMDEIAELKDNGELTPEEAQQQVDETIEKMKALRSKKDKIAKESKQRSEKAQERILEVRRRCKDLGISFDNNVNINEEINEQLQNVGEVIQKATSQIGPMINKIFDGFGISGFEGYEVKEEVTWVPESDQDNVVLNVDLQNGGIRIYGDEKRDNILIVLRKKIRSAKENVDRVAREIVDVKCASNIVSIEVKRRFNNRHTVSADIYLPTRYLYDCNLKSTNGRISIIDLTGKAWLLSTTNGRIEVKDSKADHIKAGSTNGSLKFNVHANDMELSASNGSIRYYVPELATGKVNILTTNGTVRIYTPDKLNATIDAHTRMGKVRVHDGWNINSSIKKTVGHSLNGRTVGFDEDSPQLNIVAKTTNGSVKIIEEE